LDKKIERTSIIRWDPKDRSQAAVKRAGETLLSGGIVAFPTETFYGLGVDITHDEAINNLFQVKDRSPNQPVLILIPCRETLKRCVTAIPKRAQALMDRFWPGGLTLIFHASETISSLLTAGTGKIGVRLSSHPAAADLVKAVGGPITGTSANLSGNPPCTCAEDVFMELRERIDLILDGGPTTGGKGSTILDVTVNPPVLLREGVVDYDQLKNFLSS
jgi:L-threonylcarbamoyladenylate synthase